MARYGNQLELQFQFQISRLPAPHILLGIVSKGATRRIARAAYSAAYSTQFTRRCNAVGLLRVALLETAILTQTRHGRDTEAIQMQLE
jgi:hypothetical protein